jgi:clorobiocin biosynthesis protein Clo-hal
VVVPLLQGITGGGDGLADIYRVPGVPAPHELVGYDIAVVSPFRLDLRTEPNLERGVIGRLEVYHDLVTEDVRMTHRLAAVPARIHPSLAPLVRGMNQCASVEELLMIAPSLLPAHSPEAVQTAVLEVVRVAAMKGFIELRLRGEAKVPSSPSGTEAAPAPMQSCI